MNADFHYYATYCAAQLAGYSHAESLDIAYSACFVDFCSKTLLSKIKAPLSAATTQLQLELIDARTDGAGLQDITRIWSSFHFLPYNLQARPKRRCSKKYRNKFRLICNPNSALLEETVRLAKGKSLQAAGIAMHVLADTWAHRYFAGTPSLVINNTNAYFYELLPEGEKKITFRHSASAPDDPANSVYTCSLHYNSENSIMNLGHGRAGHLPDYCFARYKYLPAWGGYEEVVKDNPSDYRHAFCQMIEAMKFLRGERETFARDTYDTQAVASRAQWLEKILHKRQLDASADWKAFGESVSGKEIAAFDLDIYQDEYKNAPKERKDSTFLGRFILAALAQKSMVTGHIFRSGSLLAGYPIDSAEGSRGKNRVFGRILNGAKGGGEA